MQGESIQPHVAPLSAAGGRGPSVYLAPAGAAPPPQLAASANSGPETSGSTTEHDLANACVDVGAAGRRLLDHLTNLGRTLDADGL